MRPQSSQPVVRVHHSVDKSVEQADEESCNTTTVILLADEGKRRERPKENNSKPDVGTAVYLHAILIKRMRKNIFSQTTFKFPTKRQIFRLTPTVLENRKLIMNVVSARAEGRLTLSARRVLDRRPPVEDHGGVVEDVKESQLVVLLPQDEEELLPSTQREKTMTS